MGLIVLYCKTGSKSSCSTDFLRGGPVVRNEDRPWGDDAQEGGKGFRKDCGGIVGSYDWWIKESER